MKERLTGAIILVVLVVLLVPELLSGPKGPAIAPAAAPNSSEEPPLRSYTINLADDSQPRTEEAGGSGLAMPQPSGPDQPTLPQLSPAQSSTPDQPAQFETPAVSSEQPTTPRVGPNEIADAQAPVASSSEAPAPKPTTPAPKAAASPPKVATSVPTMTAKPESAKPAPRAVVASEKSAKAHSSTAAPSAAIAASAGGSESGWMVQLGVFASRDNAERLALEVRVKGFKASVSAVTSASRKLYRVRVGPTPDRASAQELQGRLRAAGRPGGTVVPYS